MRDNQGHQRVIPNFKAPGIAFCIAVVLSVLPAANLRAQDQPDSARASQPRIINRQINEYTADNYRDPFHDINTKPVVAKPRPGEITPKLELPAMKVQGVLWGGRFNQAIINGGVLMEGDTVEGAKIVSIEKNKIVFLYRGSKFDLSVSEGMR